MELLGRRQRAHRHPTVSWCCQLQCRPVGASTALVPLPTNPCWTRARGSRRRCRPARRDARRRRCRCGWRWTADSKAALSLPPTELAFRLIGHNGGAGRWPRRAARCRSRRWRSGPRVCEYRQPHRQGWAPGAAVPTPNQELVLSQCSEAGGRKHRAGAVAHQQLAGREIDHGVC